MSCARILIKYPESTTPQHFYDTDGYLSVDLDADFDIKHSKRIEELTDVNKIKVSGVVGFSVDSTPKNDFIFKKYVDINSLNFKFEPIQIYCVIGSRYIVQSDLYVVYYKNKNYELEIRNGKEHWITQAKDLKLNSLDFGANVTFNQALIEQQNALNGYQDNELGYRFPLVNYGKLASQLYDIQTEDFRIWFSMLYVLQKAFCKIGWIFKSPFYESDFGRKLISYIASKNIIDNDEIKANRAFKTKVSGILQWDPEENGANIPFTLKLQDPGNNYDSVNSRYIGLGVHDISVKVKAKFTPESSSAFNHNPEECRIVTRLMYYSNGYGTIELNSIATDVNKQNGFRDNIEATLLHDFETKDVQLNAGDYVYVTLTVEKNNVRYLNILPDSIFTGTCNKVLLQENDVININQLIDNSYTLLDYLKGAIHLCNGKIITDFAKQEITVYPPYSINVFTENVEGFYYDNVLIDLTERLNKDSESIDSLNDSAKKRFKILKFKGKGDKAIEALKLKENEYLYAKTIDFGNSFNYEYEESENPFFEATLNRIYDNVVDENYNQIDIPFILDNSDNKLSFDIKPRVLIWEGQVQQFLDYNGILVSPKIRFKGVDTDLIPYAYQLSNCKYINAVGTEITQNLMYGDTADKQDLYNYFYKRWIFENEFNLKTSYQVFFTNDEFYRVSLREKFMLMSLGRTAIGRIAEITEFKNCKLDYVSVLFINERQILSPCYDFESIGGVNEIYCAQNKPDLQITKISNTYAFAISGASISNIDNVIYQWRYVNTNDWTTANDLTEPEYSFEVKMIVNYSDNCPDIIINKTQTVENANTCNNQPSIQLSQTNGATCVNIGGTITSAISTITLRYLINNDNSTLTTIVPGQCINFQTGTHVTFIAIITYSDNCTQSTINLITTI